MRRWIVVVVVVVVVAVVVVVVVVLVFCASHVTELRLRDQKRACPQTLNVTRSPP